MNKAGVTIFRMVDNLWHDSSYGFGSFNGLRMWSRLALTVRSLDNNMVRFLQTKFGLSDKQISSIFIDEASDFVRQVNIELRRLL